MPQSIALHYNDKTLTFSLSTKNLLEVLVPGTPESPQDLVSEINQALDQPIESPPLNEFLTRGDRVVLVVSDSTRYTAAERFLPLLIEKINHCGIPDQNIAILFALGIHRPMNLPEQEKVVGKEIAERITLVNHDSRDTDWLVSLGTTSRGTPVVINRRAADADKLILTGTIGFHYLAGFGGGRKSVIPGISSYETCAANHLLTLDPLNNARHLQARTGVLNGNPMHEDMMEACGQLPPTFIVNTILSPDKEILHLVAGDIGESFLQGCDAFSKYFARTIPRTADLVIASCGGYPKDINFIQSHKTIDYAMNALRPGGVMIALAACREGIGNPDFLKWIEYANPEDMVPALLKDFQVNGQTAYATLLKAQKAHILLVSELPDDVVRAMRMTPVHSMDEALKKAYEILGANPSTYVIPYGSATLPVAEV